MISSLVGNVALGAIVAAGSWQECNMLLRCNSRMCQTQKTIPIKDTERERERQELHIRLLTPKINEFRASLAVSQSSRALQLARRSLHRVGAQGAQGAHWNMAPKPARCIAASASGTGSAMEDLPAARPGAWTHHQDSSSSYWCGQARNHRIWIELFENGNVWHLKHDGQAVKKVLILVLICFSVSHVTYWWRYIPKHFRHQQYVESIRSGECFGGETDETVAVEGIAALSPTEVPGFWLALQ